MKVNPINLTPTFKGVIPVAKKSKSRSGVLGQIQEKNLEYIKKWRGHEDHFTLDGR